MSRVTMLTPTGRGAVATLRVDGIGIVDGSPSLFVATNGRPVGSQPINRICFGTWGAEEVILCRIDSDTVEIHCHGGHAAVDRIVADLQSRGVVCEDQREEDSFRSATSPFAPRKDVHSQSENRQIEAACRRALARASTLRTADILWQQCEGRLGRAILELATQPADAARKRAEQMMKWARFGRHLAQPWNVVLFGRPNVGKSSLINRLVGYDRSIVFDQPGTTRDVVSVETALDGWPVEFSDTAGLRPQADELETEGINRARQQLEQADLQVLLLVCSRSVDHEDRELMREWPEALVVAHKSDLPGRRDRLPEQALPVSSLTGEGIDELAAAIVRRLIPEVPPMMTLMPVDPSHVTLLDGFLEAGNEWDPGKALHRGGAETQR